MFDFIKRIIAGTGQGAAPQLSGEAYDRLREGFEQFFSWREKYLYPWISHGASASQGPGVQYQMWVDEEAIDGYEDTAVPDEIRAVLESPEARRNVTFVDRLQEHLAKHDLKSPDVYNAAHIDRRLFSQILSRRDYTPARDTCIALIIALKLDISEARDWLARAGYALKPDDKRDVVFEYCLRRGYNDINGINMLLKEYGLKPLGG